MKLFAPSVEGGLALARRVDAKYAPVWAGRTDVERAALAMYFLPHRSGRAVLGPTRPGVVKWYCPFADQRSFPSGHRYCINVYTGCSHGCVYCYVAGYLHMEARAKSHFRRLLARDLRDLDEFDAPAAPVHLSNSTDALQPLEERLGDTLFALRQLADSRRRFTTVTLLTKDPARLAQPEYLDALRGLQLPAGGGVVVEVSLAFWREEVAAGYDPGAPTVAERVEGIAALRRAGIEVILRVSPTYPIDLAPPGASPPQTGRDMDRLIGLAAEMGVGKVVHTPAKIVRPKEGPLHPLMEAMLRLYRRLHGPEGPDFRGGSWRLGREAALRHIVSPLREICARHGVALAFCKSHLVAVGRAGGGPVDGGQEARPAQTGGAVAADASGCPSGR